jgi:hypothetical protein
MAIALVQTSTEITVSGGTGGSVTVSGVAAGNLLVCVLDSTAADDPLLTVSDDKSNSWLQAVTNGISGAISQINYVLSAAAGNTLVSVTADVTTDFVAKVQERSGGTWTLGNTSSIDESATTSHVCSATAGEIDTTGEAVIIANSVCEQASGVFGSLTVGSGYTQISASTSAVMWQYQHFTVSESNNRGAFTSGNSRSTAAVIAAFLCSASGCTPCWWPCCTPCETLFYTLFFGNKVGAVALSSVEQYTPSPTDSWATMTSGSPARQGASTASLSGAAYTFGGLEASSPFYMDDNDEYVTDAWTAKTDMPSPSRHNHEGLTVGSYCYSVYGDDGTSKLRDADQYDPSGNSWTSKTDAPANARYYLGAAGIGTKGYTWGGHDGVSVRDCEEYDPSGNSWTSKTDMPTPARSGCGGFDIGSDGYSTGGDAATNMNDTDKYTPGSDTWAADQDLPAGHQWTGDESDGSVGYSTNGQVTPGAGSGRSLDHYGFAPGSPGTWTTLANATGDPRQLGSAGFVA